MIWFKHMTDASNGETISDIEDHFGLEGYGRFFKLLEVVASKSTSETFYAEYSWKKWQTFLKGKRKKLETFLKHLENKQEINMIETGNVLRIEVPNLAKFKQKDLGRSRPSRDQPAPRPPLEKEKEKEEEEEKDSVPKNGGEIPSWFLDLHSSFPEQKPMGKTGGKKRGVKAGWEAYEKLSEEERIKRVELIEPYRELLGVTPDRPSCSLESWFGPKSNAWSDALKFKKGTDADKPDVSRFEKFSKKILPLLKYLGTYDTPKSVFTACCKLVDAGLTGQQIIDAWTNYTDITEDPDSQGESKFQQKFEKYMVYENVVMMAAKTGDEVKALKKERWDNLKKG